MLRGGRNTLMGVFQRNEKRDYIRMAMNTCVSFTITGTPHRHTGICKNLSHSGIRVETDIDIKPGAVLNVTIDLGNPKFAPLKATVEVVRVDPIRNSCYSIGGKITGMQ